eukprot:COSAG04_NODE_4286_length_2184_cov_1.406715_3_plen_187_part_00
MQAQAVLHGLPHRPNWGSCPRVRRRSIAASASGRRPRAAAVALQKRSVWTPLGPLFLKPAFRSQCHRVRRAAGPRAACDAAGWRAQYVGLWVPKASGGVFNGVHGTEGSLGPGVGGEEGNGPLPPAARRPPLPPPPPPSPARRGRTTGVEGLCQWAVLWGRDSGAWCWRPTTPSTLISLLVAGCCW